jgi:hypothetical protein
MKEKKKQAPIEEKQGKSKAALRYHMMSRLQETPKIGEEIKAQKDC